MDAIFYVVRTGCWWRQLPAGFPPWPTVYWYFVRFEPAKATEESLPVVRGQLRLQEGRGPQPSAGLIDSHTVANGYMAEPIPVYDGLRQRLAGLVAKQPAGDPAAAAQAPLKIVDSNNPPLRVLFGLGFYPMLQQAYADRLKIWADWQDLSAEAQGAPDRADR